jgi:hypothetical protein
MLVYLIERIYELRRLDDFMCGMIHIPCFMKIGTASNIKLLSQKFGVL